MRLVAGRVGRAGAPGPLPNVPTLVLDGEADLRTPVDDAHAVAARIPGAQSSRSRSPATP